MDCGRLWYGLETDIIQQVIFLPNSFSLSSILLNETSILVNSLKTKRLRLHTLKQSKHVASNSWNILY